MFPPIDFSLAYSDKDKKLYTFMVHSVIRAYGNFYFEMDRIQKVTIRPEMVILDGRPCLGATYFSTDTMALTLPTRPSAFALGGLGSLIAHEFAHHIIQEYYGETAEARRLGNDLPHYWANTEKYGMTKTYWSPTFITKYGFPGIRIFMPNIQALIDNKDKMLSEIKAGKATGPHVYWQ